MKKHSNRFEKVAKILMYIMAGMLPLWFVPWPAGVEAGREVSFAVAILLATVFWLFSVLSTGEIRLRLSPVLYAAGLFVAVLAISAFLSLAPGVSIWFADSIGERVFTVLLGFLLMILVGSLFRKEDVKKFIFIFVAAGVVSALINLLQLSLNISIFKYLSNFAGGQFFNAIGTQNGLAVFYVLILALLLGVLTSPVSQRSWGTGLRWGAWVGVVFLLANILLINFRTAWIVLLGVSIFLFGLISKNLEEKDGSLTSSGRETSTRNSGRHLDWRGWTAIGLLIFSVVMILIKVPLWSRLNLPAEVSPSPRATLDIGLKVFKEGPRAMFFGSGPGSFGTSWGKYKDPSINQTVFWGLRFNQGSSWATTLLPTTGLIGFGSFLLFVLSALYLFLKQSLTVRRAEQDDYLVSSLLLGYIVLLISSFLYGAGLFMVLAIFAITSLLIVALSKERAGEDIWTVGEKQIKFSSPWAVFLSSLSLIFVIALAVTGLYREGGKIRAALAFQEGINNLNAGKIDEAAASFEKMTLLDNNNFRNYQLLTQVNMEKIRNLVARSLRGENVQQEFQNVMSAAIQNSQRAIQLHPTESSVWRMQGSLYELIIPLVQGAERFAFDSYKKAAELEPANPVIWVELGRAGLVFTDKLVALGNQASSKEKEQINQLRASVLQEITQAFQKAVGLKADYAPAHFLLAQTAMRQGNSAEAIRNVENAKLSAPFDIGVAFQLGLLYYQSSDLNRARVEFERAVSLNSNYSNGRYFLGLVYDRQGNQKKAIEQFEKVLELNPDNQEVQKILRNLENNRDALAGIAPPGTPPEKRSSAPVEEKDEVVKPAAKRRR